MMREEISENEGMIHLLLLIVFIKIVITHSFFLIKKQYKPYV